jgi:hypothetical protein
MNVMTTRSWKMLVPIALATMLVVMLAVDPALAQTTTTPAPGGSTTNIGKNLGNEITSWGKALLLGTAGLVGASALGRRDVADAMKIGLIVLVVGGFLFATGAVESIINAFWSTVSG